MDSVKATTMTGKLVEGAHVHRNLSTPQLVEAAIARGEASLADNGALVAMDPYTGRTLAMVGGSILAAHQKPYAEKLSAYECGFEAFDQARSKFDVRYYLVAILFIIFDLEIAFLFPWAVSLNRTGGFGLAVMGVFLFILVIGFAYEWKRGALEWD